MIQEFITLLLYTGTVLLAGIGIGYSIRANEKESND